MESVGLDRANGRSAKLAPANGPVRAARCTVCGSHKPSDCTKKEGPPWFLMTENQGQDKLNIWKWDRQMATQASVHSLCSPRHVRELAVHWMATGRLLYPFAKGPSPVVGGGRRSAPTAFAGETAAACVLGELMVDRFALIHVLKENAMSLNILLDELMAVLGHTGPKEPESLAEDACRLWLRTM